jgi:tetraacyldisaccharide 4'-kinase
VVAFAGIGRPEKFFATLRGLGAQVASDHPFPDHHRFTAADISALRQAAERDSARLVTTEKDWVRLTPDLRDGIATLPVDISWADESAVTALLAPVLHPNGLDGG